MPVFHSVEEVVAWAGGGRPGPVGRCNQVVGLIPQECQVLCPLEPGHEGECTWFKETP